MIKVNLLKTHTGPKSSPALPKKPAPYAALALLVIILLPVAGLAAWWFTLNGQIGSLTSHRDELRVENQRLEALKKQLDEYEKKKKERQSRIQVIERLKTNQTGPVLLLSHVIHSIPVNSVLWLTELEQQGDRIRIEGQTTRGESIPDFMSGLTATGFFKTVDLELYEDQDKGAAKFRLVCMTANRAPSE
ncbi:MAG: hypothetical protein FJW35_13420 [Acidobacteria bacterium]|nr:hypothetical protein [Acidobacteriota bacterium]